ncbi:MAG: hypothetical protein IIA11_02665 [Proteobacteria bacterium]|nr:hypothetical protein [Pseudomonadota bacterium]
MSRPKSSRITADKIWDVRNALDETQAEFAERFSRSRFTIIRWEQSGVKFGARSTRLRAWDLALVDARNMT